MAEFSSDGVKIAYEAAGEGRPVLLIHGFASNARVNWRDTSWTRTLTEAGFSAISFDNRGHGMSAKPRDPERYGSSVMAEDARRLLDRLGIARAHVMGYSMGARIAAFLALAHPARVERLVLGGLAANLIRGFDNAEAIAHGLEAPRREDVTDPAARAFRIFAEQTGSDLPALAACMRATRQTLSAAELSLIRCPALVVAGEIDEIAGPVRTLVDAIPGAGGLTLKGRNHMNAVGDKEFKAAVIAFLRAPP